MSTTSLKSQVDLCQRSSMLSFPEMETISYVCKFTALLGIDVKLGQLLLPKPDNTNYSKPQ